jgi:hypothetical protein
MTRFLKTRRVFGELCGIGNNLERFPGKWPFTACLLPTESMVSVGLLAKAGLTTMENSFNFIGFSPQVAYILHIYAFLRTKKYMGRKKAPTGFRNPLGRCFV